MAKKIKNRILNLLGEMVIFIGFLLMILFTLWTFEFLFLILKDSLKNYFQLLGISTNFDLPLIILSSGVIFISVLRLYNKHISKKNHQICKEIVTKKINNFFIKIDKPYLIMLIFIFVALVLAFIPLSLDTYRIDKFYVNYAEIKPYDYSINISKESKIEMQKVVCESRSKKEYFTQGDQLVCSLDLIYRKEGYELSQIVIDEFDVNQNLTNGVNNAIWRPCENSTRCDFFIPLSDKPGFFEYFVHFYFKHNDEQEEYFYFKKSLNIISYEEYYNKTRSKLPLILGFFSVAFFSLLAGMKNLQDIVEKK